MKIGNLYMVGFNLLVLMEFTVYTYYYYYYYYYYTYCVHCRLFWLVNQDHCFT